NNDDNNQAANPSETTNEEQGTDELDVSDEKDSGESEIVDEKETKDEDIEEYSVIEEHIDLNKYEMDVKEDNSHKRIILYETKEYKSIFLKDQDRLKIIQFNHGQIFNEVIS